MKKVMLMLVVAMLSVVSVFAVERTVAYEYKVITALINDKKYDEAKAYLDTCIITNDIIKVSVARCYYHVDLKVNGKQATPELVLAKVQEYITLVGLTDPDMIVLTKLQPLFFNGFYAEAIALGKDNQNKLVQNYLIHCYMASSKFDEAYKAAMFTNDILNAFTAVVRMGDKVKAFELGKQITLNKYVTPALLSSILDKLGEMNFAGTTVTKDMEIEFLKALNEKYSRFLIKDKTTWEPIIAGIRLTIEVKSAK